MLKWRKKDTGIEEDGADSSADPLMSSWTYGSALTTKALTAGMWTCLVAGPLALLLLIVGLGGSGSAPSARATGLDSADVASSQAAGEFARGFTAAWLRGVRGQESQVAAYLGGSVPMGLSLPQAARAASEIAVATVTDHGPGQWAATIGVTVTAATGSVRRYFSVPIHGDGVSFVAGSLPTPIAAPAVGAAPTSQYGSVVPSTSTVWQSVSGFLAAMLAGQSEVARFTSPNAVITPITPAPYSDITIASIVANRDLTKTDSAPSSGAQVKVLATVNGTGADATSTVQYPLDLVGRDGRWEVAGLDLYPLDTSGSAATSSDTTEGETQ